MKDCRDTDLFGKPVDPGKGRRGRPRKMLDETDLDMLEAGLTKGWSDHRIAKALDIGESTLKRNFGPIMRARHNMPDRLQLALFAMTVRKALSEDMGAVRQLQRMIAEDERAVAEARVSLPQEQTMAAKRGKKEISEIQAADAEAALFEEIEKEAKGVYRH